MYGGIRDMGGQLLAQVSCLVIKIAAALHLLLQES